MKTVKDLTEAQWAKIHGRRAGNESRTARYNPYHKDLNDKDGTLAKIWEEARMNRILGIE